MLIAGLGCRRGCPAAHIIALVQRALQHLQHSLGTAAAPVLTALATPHFKMDEPGLQQAARWLGLPLIPIDAALLAAVQARCQTFSIMGAVAEGCALAACGPDAVLGVPRLACARATCAIAMIPACVDNKAPAQPGVEQRQMMQIV